jgi:ferritin
MEGVTIMLSKKMEKALNGQINAEMYSSYLYLAMSAYFESIGLGGFSRWMQAQAQEELIHAMKFYHFVNERGGRVMLEAIEAPTSKWKSPLAVFQATYAHEQKVTGLINGLADLAVKEKDHATNSFLQWFVTEQVEEEATAGDIVNKLKLVSDAPGGLFLIDRELGARAFPAPSTTE